METAGASSVTVITQVTILQKGVAVGFLTDIMPGGSITLDITAENIRTCTFQCIDPANLLIPIGFVEGILTPDGVEVLIEKGFLIDGQSYLWPQGVFWVTECDVATGAGGNVDPGPVITVDGTDRSLRISEALFNDVFNTTPGATATQAILEILASQAPWVTTNIEPTDFVIAQQTYAPGTDPMQSIQSIALAAGMVAYFDASGIFVVRTNPSAGGAAASVAIADGPSNFANSVTAVTSNSPGYNGVIVVGTNPTNNDPVVGVAYDMDPASQTYAPTYGYVPAPPVQASAVTTIGQATLMAQAMLPQVLGLTRTVAMDVLPLPSLDAYSLVYVSNADTAVQGTFLLQLGTISMDYSVLDNITVIPIGSPLDQLLYNKGPSDAAYVGTANLAAGGAAFSYGANGYVWTPYGSSSSTSGSFGGIFGAEGIVRPGLDVARRVLFDGPRLFRDFPGFGWLSSLGSGEDVE
jgi:hypothetical protein